VSGGGRNNEGLGKFIRQWEGREESPAPEQQTELTLLEGLGQLALFIVYTYVHTYLCVYKCIPPPQPSLVFIKKGPRGIFPTAVAEPTVWLGRALRCLGSAAGSRGRG